MEHRLVTGTSDAQEQQRAIDLVRPLFDDFKPGADDSIIGKKLFGAPSSEVDLLLQGQELLGFGIVELFTGPQNESILYRAGTIVNQRFQEMRLYRLIVGLPFCRHRPDFISTRTQVPRVYGAWLSMFGDSLFPRPGETAPVQLQKIAETVRTDRPVDSNLIVRDVYDIDRTQRHDRAHRSEAINAFFEEQLGKFDAFMLVSRITEEVHETMVALVGSRVHVAVRYPARE